ncbi:Camk4, partial [Symbiodinium pilosum]
MKFNQVGHCNVVRQKKKTKVNGKVIWEKPRYTKLYSITLPSGKKIQVKSGTQIIDRCWQHTRGFLHNTARAPQNPVMTRKIRSAQRVYWHGTQNLRTCTGKMLDFLFED